MGDRGSDVGEDRLPHLMGGRAEAGQSRAHKPVETDFALSSPI